MIGIIIFFVLFETVHCQLLNQNLVNYTSLFGDNPRCGRNFTNLAEYDGYKVETHYVITSDGYILILYHMFPNAKCTEIKTIHVLFMHGLYLCADDCIIPGPKKAICYILADACYHVWIGNCRGNKYARNHTIYDPNKDKIFWRFSFEDMARFDMPAIIDYILIQTCTTQIYYIGHSQGMTVLILLLSFVKEYNDKIKFAIGLSTASYLYYATLIVLSLQAALSTENVLYEDGELFPYGGTVQKLADTFCATSDVSYPACTSLVFALFRCNFTSLSPETIAVAVSLEPAGTSIKNCFHWGGVVRNGFARYDYGTVQNLQQYNALAPPTYDLGNYTANTILVYSDNDCICDPLDAGLLKKSLYNCPNCTLCKLTYKILCHIDYIYSDCIPIYIAPIFLAAFDNCTRVCT